MGFVNHTDGASEPLLTSLSCEVTFSNDASVTRQPIDAGKNKYIFQSLIFQVNYMYTETHFPINISSLLKMKLILHLILYFL